MKKIALIFLLLVCGVILIIPHLAEAKAGSGRSMGSMGSHTYQPSPLAAPIQRSITRPSTAIPSSPSVPYYNPSFSSFNNSHPFLTGLAGGFLGAGLAGLLFGHGWGDGLSTGGAGGLGVLPLLILAAIGYLIFRSMRRNNTIGGMSDGSSPFPSLRPDAPFNVPPFPIATDSPTGIPLTPTSADYQDFMQLLEKIQLAWGTADINQLRQYVTPEMLSYFSEELSANVSRGVVNRVTNVVATEGTLINAWSEQDLDYATVHLKWRAIDYMARADLDPTDAHYVVSGEATQPSDIQEIWTFVRARDGGHWLLSAIQQVTAQYNAA